MSSEAESGKRRYLQLAETIAETIKEQHLEAGARLPSERDFASKHEVSRQTIREALIALEVAGIVEIRLGSGIYVKNAQGNAASALQYEDAPGPLEILEARQIIEAEAAALAAERISNEEIQKLRALIKLMKAAGERGDPYNAEEQDRKFHQTIAEASRNSALSSMIDWLWQLRNKSEISRFYHEKAREYEKTSNAAFKNVAEHQSILDALTRHNGAAAKQAMADHIGRVHEEFCEFSLG